MTFSEGRAERNGPIRRSDESLGQILDQEAILRLSATDAEPSAQLRLRVLASFEGGQKRSTSAWTWLIPVTASALIACVVMAQSYWRLRLPQPPIPLTMVAKPMTASPMGSADQVLVKPPHARRATRPRHEHRLPEPLQAKRSEATGDLPVAQFDSLLYCDPFSCGDPMQVIRLEVPAASVGRAYQPLARHGFVNAEVIVGADGLTRAVRFTK